MSRSIHFYKLNSRLGLINCPIHATEFNYGVEKGPQAVLTPEFLQQFFSSQVFEYSFSLPENIEKDNYLTVVATESQQAMKLINETINDGVQVVIGGDHSVALPPLASVIERYGNSRVGHVQFDSHGDLHKVSTSPTGNFHGMWLRPFLGDFDHEDVQQIIPAPLRPSQLLYVGNLELEEEEKRLVKQFNIPIITRDVIRRSIDVVMRQLADFIARYDHIHLSFDIDVFHQSLVTATGTPSLDGLYKEDVFPLLQVIKNHAKRLSIDLVEVNPQKSGAQETTALAQEVLHNVLP